MAGVTILKHTGEKIIPTLSEELFTQFRQLIIFNLPEDKCFAFIISIASLLVMLTPQWMAPQWINVPCAKMFYYEDDSTIICVGVQGQTHPQELPLQPRQVSLRRVIMSQFMYSLARKGVRTQFQFKTFIGTVRAKKILPSWRQPAGAAKCRSQFLSADGGFRRSAHPSVWHAIYASRRELKAPPIDIGR